jgi:hypothetical protein
MGWLDKLFGREKHVGQHDNEVSETDHERHLEQSANPGSAPVVPPDVSEEASADEVEEERQDARGEEKLEETRGRDDQEGRFTREPPRSF